MSHPLNTLQMRKERWGEDDLTRVLWDFAEYDGWRGDAQGERNA